MDVKQLFTLFRNHTHTGAYPDAKKLPPWALAFSRTTGVGLLSPNNSRWILGVAEDGAFTVTSAQYSNLLTSPSGRVFSIGVDSDGAPTTSPSTTELTSITFVRYIILVDSLGVAWDLSIADDGAIVTTPSVIP